MGPELDHRTLLHLTDRLPPENEREKEKRKKKDRLPPPLVFIKKPVRSPSPAGPPRQVALLTGVHPQVHFEVVRGAERLSTEGTILASGSPAPFRSGPSNQQPILFCNTGYWMSESAYPTTMHNHAPCTQLIGMLGAAGS